MEATGERPPYPEDGSYWQELPAGRHGGRIIARVYERPPRNQNMDIVCLRNMTFDPKEHPHVYYEVDIRCFYDLHTFICGKDEEEDLSISYHSH